MNFSLLTRTVLVRAHFISPSLNSFEGIPVISIISSDESDICMTLFWIGAESAPLVCQRVTQLSSICPLELVCRKQIDNTNKARTTTANFKIGRKKEARKETK